MTFHINPIRIFIALSFCLTTTPVLAADDSQIINLPPSLQHWETTREGVGFAPLQGDRFAEAYMAMVHLPAGLISPAHVKSATMYGMVISGTITNIALGADPDTEMALPAGSFYKIPAGLAHISKCISDVDCITFLYQDGKFDFVPVSQ